MLAEEIRDCARLSAMAARASTARIHDVHSGIARRVFTSVGSPGAPVRIAHDLIAGVAYRGVGTALGASLSSVGLAAAVAGDRRSLDEAGPARVGLAILNGLVGDRLPARAPSLAFPMAVRVAGRNVEPSPAALAAAFPDATDGIAVFLHGLTETEGAWCYRSDRVHGRPGITYGDLLRRDIGLTAVFVRYNTGRHISDNGRELDQLLARLAESWPLPLRDIVLIGHSMGGLVARSALHQAGSGTDRARAWTRLVRDTITLGSPHLGAPLERAAHLATNRLARLPETRAISRALAARSAGIKDLRYGTLVEADWAGRDLDAAGRGPHTRVPLADGARHFVVLATLARDESSLSARLVGDLLVPPRSARGEARRAGRFGFPADHVLHVGRRHHFQLLNDPAVYAAIRRWLVSRPEGSRRPSG